MVSRKSLSFLFWKPSCLSFRFSLFFETPHLRLKKFNFILWEVREAELAAQREREKKEQEEKKRREEEYFGLLMVYFAKRRLPYFLKSEAIALQSIRCFDKHCLAIFRKCIAAFYPSIRAYALDRSTRSRSTPRLLCKLHSSRLWGRARNDLHLELGALINLKFVGACSRVAWRGYRLYRSQIEQLKIV